MQQESQFWHVCLTLAGPSTPAGEVHAALQRLAEQHPFLMAGRYGDDQAEVTYWDEAADARTASEMALRLWDEHRATADLPPWQVVALEVAGREVFQQRVPRGERLSTGDIRPY